MDYFQLHTIRNTYKYLTGEAASSAIHAFVTSRLDYANSLLYGLPKSQIKRLQRVKNVAAQLLTGAKYREHITPVLRDLHWLPIARRMEYKILVLAFKAIHGTAPAYISKLIKIYEPTRSLRSSFDATKLVVPKTRLKTGGDRAFCNSAPVLWNQLPSALRSVDSLDCFKCKLKTHLFTCEYGSSA